MTTRYLSRPVFDELPATDKLRAYLLLRTTPTRARVLQRLTGETNIRIMIEGLLKAGMVRCSLGHYLVTIHGRTALAEMLPPGVVGLAGEEPHA